MIDALRHGGDLLNVFGDFPTLTDPRHADAYSPLWDAQLGLWTPKAIKEGLDTRQIDEVQVFNLAATRPDLLTGGDPATAAASTVRLGRRRHQLRGHRLVGQQATDGQPRAARSGLAVPAALIRQPGGATTGRPAGRRGIRQLGGLRTAAGTAPSRLHSPHATGLGSTGASSELPSGGHTALLRRPETSLGTRRGVGRAGSRASCFSGTDRLPLGAVRLVRPSSICGCRWRIVFPDRGSA